MANNNNNESRRSGGTVNRGKSGRRSMGAHGKTPAKNEGASIAEKISGIVENFKPHEKSAKASHGKSRKVSEDPKSAGDAIAGVGNFFTEAGIWILSNRVATIVAGALIVIALGGIVDGIAHWGRAYDNVTVNGVSVGGMTKEEIVSSIQESTGNTASNTKITITLPAEYRSSSAAEEAPEEETAQASDEAAEPESSEEGEAESSDEASQDGEGEGNANAEEDNYNRTSWDTSMQQLGATIPAETIADEALSVGRRADGGPLQRFGLFFVGEDVPVSIDVPEDAVEKLSTKIDKSIGQDRVDANVYVNNGKAEIVPGKDGKAVDRQQLTEALSSALMSGESTTTFDAPVTDAHSRITTEQAQQACEQINRAIAAGATFTYDGKSWTAKPAELGDWTYLETVEDEGGYKLHIYIDEDIATKAIVKGVNATIKSDKIKVTFEGSGEDITVHTQGDTSIPEVPQTVAELDEALYGENGRAWAATEEKEPIKLDVNASTAPETLSVEQAEDLGIITVIGEYTTEFSNYEGTENRNHNIKLVADIIDGSVARADGGVWSFNEQTGDTTKDPPFASAGSIIDGRHVDSIGGGICQVATTVFNAVYEAGLDIVERHNHSYYIANYPTGRDVGVSYGEMEFKWKNSLPNDVLLKTSYTDTSVTAKLYSVATGYQVTSETGEWEKGAKYGVEFVEDSSLAPGSSYVETAGEDGSSITVKRTVKDSSGKIISEQQFDSVYWAQNEVIAIGPGTDTSGMGRTDSGSTVEVRPEEETYTTVQTDVTGEQATTYVEDTGTYYEDTSAYGYDDASGLYDDGAYGDAYGGYESYGDPYGLDDSTYGNADSAMYDDSYGVGESYGDGYSSDYDSSDTM